MNSLWFLCSTKVLQNTVALQQLFQKCLQSILCIYECEYRFKYITPHEFLPTSRKNALSNNFLISDEKCNKLCKEECFRTVGGCKNGIQLLLKENVHNLTFQRLTV